MYASDSGWAWFEEGSEVAKTEEPTPGAERDLLLAYARFLHTENGRRIMRHLKAITVDRVLGPDVSEAMLRHLEGQRQLVSYIEVLAERGSGHADLGGLPAIASN
ncbi:MAG: hypothetical protein HC801_14155 [Nitrospira sp.]|nr:hypothetical protein [Nitrospira sp.]